MIRPGLLAYLICFCALSACNESPTPSERRSDFEIADGVGDKTKSVSYADAETHLQDLLRHTNPDLAAEARKLRWNGSVDYILALQDHPDKHFSSFIEKNIRKISANAPVETRRFESLGELFNQDTGIRIFFITDRSQLSPYDSLIEIGKLDVSSEIDGLGCRMEQWILDEPDAPRRNIIIQVDADFPDPESLKQPYYAFRRIKNDDGRNMFWQHRCSLCVLMNSMGFAAFPPDTQTAYNSAYSPRGAESSLTKYDLAALQLFYMDAE